MFFDFLKNSLNGEELNLQLNESSKNRTRMIIGVKASGDVLTQQRRVVPIQRKKRLTHVPNNHDGMRLRTDAHSGLPDGAKKRKRKNNRAPEYMIVDSRSIMKHPDNQMSCCEMVRNFFTGGW